MMTKTLVAALVAVLLAGSAMADDADPGAAELQKCKICHSLEKGGPNRVGPNLFGVFGSKAASAPGFNYSDAMKASGIVWDDNTLAQFLREPRGLMPGNRMSFPGIKDDGVLTGLLAKLKLATQ